METAAANVWVYLVQLRPFLATGAISVRRIDSEDTQSFADPGSLAAYFERQFAERLAAYRARAIDTSGTEDPTR
jgi:hypothetical protein